jgi:hypothetical protein
MLDDLKTAYWRDDKERLNELKFEIEDIEGAREARDFSV